MYTSVFFYLPQWDKSLPPFFKGRMRMEEYIHLLQRPSSSSEFTNLLNSEINGIWKSDWRNSSAASWLCFSNHSLLLKMSYYSFFFVQVQFLQVISLLCIFSCCPRPTLTWFAFWLLSTLSHFLDIEIRLSVLWCTEL